MNNLMQTIQLLNQFKEFSKQFEKGKQDPQAILDNLISSGKVSQQQLQQAKDMAQIFQNLLGR